MFPIFVRTVQSQWIEKVSTFNFFFLVSITQFSVLIEINTKSIPETCQRMYICDYSKYRRTLLLAPLGFIYLIRQPIFICPFLQRFVNKPFINVIVW